MQVVDPKDIFIGDRFRRKMDAAALADLKNSILGSGLYHAPMIRYDRVNERWALVTGERRLASILSIHAENLVFFYDGKAFAPGEAPFVTLSDPSEENIVVAEAEENLMREDFSWIDRAQALAKIHEVRTSTNPQQRLIDTAEEIVKSTGSAKSSAAISKEISQARIVAKHLDDPEIAKSRNASEAYAKILRRDEERINVELHTRAQADVTTIRCELVHASAIDFMPTVAAGLVDLILTDPPYGIGANSAGFRSRGEKAHEYDDSPKAAEAILQAILIDGWRITKTRANLFIFTDIDRWEFLKGAASRMGWSPFRTPIIWNKSMMEGMNPWGANGPLRVSEIIFYATKGQRGLLKSFPDVLFHPRVRDENKVFAAQKPHSLLRQLIEASTIVGDTVFDPCAGSGAHLRSARLLGRASLGCELNETTFNSAMGFINTPLAEYERSTKDITDL